MIGLTRFTRVIPQGGAGVTAGGEALTSSGSNASSFSG